ncbi:hypothetical protein [Sphaerisporangium sp. TRM90804]|uniref:metallophosphoesterase family protein n=1 Tax=Sphaerisporangium sp. TRM90804 TaxID=3031113 RepID=UPI00244BCAA0|nr:hypothetical protein [Sphaerisporangium sp. TRM90804]MDH2424786.1 hypothetical protein [Sphaerisporangium sp. TRM90804]
MPDPTRVLVAGDWHGRTSWAFSVLRRLPELLPGGSTRIVLHLGDFGVWPGGDHYLNAVDRYLEEAGAVLWFVDGNHEDFSQLNRIPLYDGMGAVTDRIWHLPRGYRWKWHDRTWLALGGAVSVDRALRAPGETWWPDEEITQGQARRAADDGHADVMVCHDAPSWVPLNLPAPPSLWAPEDLRRANKHRGRLQDVVDEVQPSHLLHGHYHLAHRTDVDMHYGTCHVTGLDCDGSAHNYDVLNVQTMQWEGARRA